MKIYIIIIIVLSFSLLSIYENTLKKKKGITRLPAQIQTVNTKTINSPYSSKIISDNIKTEEFNLKNELLKINKLFTCINNNCNIPANDPRALELAIDKKIARNLNSIEIPKKPTYRQLDLIKTIVEKCLTFEGDYSREAVINLISKLPLDKENVKIIINSVENSSSPNLYKTAFIELSKYRDKTSQILIYNFIKKTITRGPHGVASSMAVLIDPVLNPSNLRNYKKLLDILPQKAKRYKNLLWVIKEKELLYTSG